MCPTSPPTLPTQVDGWQGLRALVLGAGESGLACARWLARQGARVTLVDSRAMARPDIPEAVEFHAGLGLPFSEALLEDQDLLVPSPGLSMHADRASSVENLVRRAGTEGLALASELDLFEWALDQMGCAEQGSQGPMDAPELALGRPAVIGITGTNGKTTTAALTARLIEASGLDVQLAGNVSPSLLTALMARLESGVLPQVWVLELSSFQLAWSARFGPTASVVLNLTEDHLDWHQDMADYRSAKLRILGLPSPSGRLVIPRDDPSLAQAMLERAGRSEQACWSFGLSEPDLGMAGLGIRSDGLDWIVLRPAPQAALERLMPAAALRLVGSHNRLNAMAALALGLSVTDALAPMLHALRAYTGEPHRLSPLRTIQGVEFVNDSKGTNVGATIAALQDGDAPLAVILGGEGKGQDFGPLAQALAQRGACAVGIGRDGPAILRLAQGRGVPTLEAGDLSEAVPMAHDWVRDRMRQSGRSQGQVLLSPACASFDQFQNYGHRGETFAALVDALAQAREAQP